MGMTMTQKILAAHAGVESVKAGDLIMANLDLVLANDITGPVAINVFQNIDTEVVFDKEKIAWYRTILHRIRILRLRNNVNWSVALPVTRPLPTILKLERWEWSMPFCLKRVWWLPGMWSLGPIPIPVPMGL